MVLTCRPRTRRWLFATLLLAFSLTTIRSEAKDDGMIFLQFGAPEFRAGLEKYGMEADAGYRLHNTGFERSTFGSRWLQAPLLDKAQASGHPYYIDRIMGGMPFQSLEGIGEVADRLKSDSNFLGFQAHEWGNSPTHDYHRIHSLILDKGLPFNAESFAALEGSTQRPYFSSGDFSIFRDLFREIKTQEEVETYLSDYFKQLIALTEGQLISVTGHGQLHHTALRLGAKNVMAEIGNQVPLTAFQIACARGAGRQHGKPFGAYYEPWGGKPMGCICATSFSPWWPLEPKMKELMDGYNIGPQHGSSRSLQRRLLYYAWLSGAAWWSEEWGAENYFTNWEDYPITTYGQIVRDFQTTTRDISRPEPMVPIAVVMPPETFGIDIRYMAGYSDTLWRIAPGDEFHNGLRRFGKAFLATQRAGGGGDSHNLTPSPWIGCFDVFDADVPQALLKEYERVVYFDEEQSKTWPDALLFDDSDGVKKSVEDAINNALPFRVTGEVGVAQSRADGRYLIGVFNNLGVTKSTDGEVADPAMVRTVQISGPIDGFEVLTGSDFIGTQTEGSLELTIPAGELVVLSVPIKD